MCGIVGYIGPKEACPILINGLKRLEYRGYDSAGIALIHNNNIQVYKCKGRVQDLEHHMELEDTSATIGMGHTRWATHGEPNDTNAHPHTSMNGLFSIVHNGISTWKKKPNSSAAANAASGGHHEWKRM